MPAADREQRIECANAAFAEADRLNRFARHPTMQQQVVYAMRDLEEATQWLAQENIAARPHILEIADIVIGMAESRLKMIADALNRYGPDAMLIG